MSKRLKCTVISDTHSAHEKLNLPGGDILFHCGDLTYEGQPDEVMPALQWLVEQDYKHVVFVAGNHDFGFENISLVHELGCRTKVEESGVVDAYHAFIAEHEKLHYLQNESVEIEGYTIYGSPYTPEFNNWAFSYGSKVMRPYSSLSTGQMVDIYDEIPACVDIIMTHGPALGVLDTNNSYGRMYGDNRCGCKHLRDRIDELQESRWGHKGPLYHLFGHIHERGGKRHYKPAKRRCGRNLVSINAAMCGIPYDCLNHTDGMNFYLTKRLDK